MSYPQVPIVLKVQLFTLFTVLCIYIFTYVEAQNPFNEHTTLQDVKRFQNNQKIKEISKWQKMLRRTLKDKLF